MLVQFRYRPRPAKHQPLTKTSSIIIAISTPSVPDSDEYYCRIVGAFNDPIPGASVIEERAKTTRQHSPTKQISVETTAKRSKVASKSTASPKSNAHSATAVVHKANINDSATISGTTSPLHNQKPLLSKSLTPIGIFNTLKSIYLFILRFR
jgi:hypothetical protein